MTMVLKVHVQGARSYTVGDEIWHESLADAIIAEAETIATYAGCDLLESPGQAHRAALRGRIAHEMTSALVSIGDEYRAPDGVLYSLIDEPRLGPLASEGTLSPMSSRASEPLVEQVLRFEDLPPGSAGTRRAMVRWSDGSESVAMTWYGGLCGDPHKLDYGETRVMPRGWRDRWPCAASCSEASA